MLGRHLAAYLPAVLVPAALSLGSLVVYSRVLSPAEYGRLTLVMTVTMVAIALASRWLAVGITRLYPAAERDGRAGDFVVTVLTVCAVSIACGLLGVAGFVAAAQGAASAPHGLNGLAASGFLILAGRMVVVATNAVRRAQLRIGRYALIECSQALGSFAGGIAAGAAFGWSAASILAGTAFGMAATGALEVACLRLEIVGKRFDRLLFASLFRFAGPLTLTYGLSLILASADQLFVQVLIGTDSAGLYGAVVSLANRPVVLVFAGVSMVMFPLSVRALEHEGEAACRARERQNVELVMATALPAACFLIAAAPQVIHLLLGQSYREAALVLLPWIVAATFINRIAVDVFDHAFYLAQRTQWLFATLIPAALASIAANLLLIPAFGILGAAMAKVIEAAVLLAFSVAIGQRLLTIELPGGAVLRIAGATGAMMLAILYVAPPPGVAGFALVACVGAAVYGLCAWMLDVMGIRRQSIGWFRARRIAAIGPDIAFYLPNLAGGGAERVVLALAEGLAARGHRVCLLVGQRTGALVDAVPASVACHTLGTRGTFASIPALVCWLARTRPVVLISSMGHNNVAASIAARLAGGRTRLVVCQHNSLAAECAPGRPLRFRLLPLAYRLTLPLADRVVGVSHGVAREMERMCARPSLSVLAIHNPAWSAVHLRLAHIEPSDPWLADAAVPVILGLGRLVVQKDFATLITAFAMARAQGLDARLMVAGDGPEHDALATLITARGLQDCCRLVGFQPNSAALLFRARLLVMSSRWEGFGNVLVEAMGCGTPVVATDCPHGPAEILADGHFGALVPVGDAAAMSQAILLAMRTKPDRAALRVRAEAFSVDRAVTAYAELCAGLTRRAAVPQFTHALETSR
jgi:glycosyltransferase involved in cell wall biosynthesis/O-antigen/teichoic acid export membrane protein